MSIPGITRLLERSHIRGSLAGRVTLMTTVVTGLLVAVLAVGSYFVVRQQMISTLDRELMQRTQYAAGLFDAPAVQAIPTWVLGAGDVRVAVVESTGRVYIPDTDSHVFPLSQQSLEVAQGELGYGLTTVDSEGSEYRVASFGLHGGRALVVAQSLHAQHALLNKLALLMGVVGGLGVLAAGGAGWAIAVAGLRPVRRLTRDVERIAQTEDLTPLPVDGNDEIARLARAFNEMLISLAASRDRQRQLVADAGHELRTPLTSMRTNIDLLTQAGASLDAEQRAELMADIRAQMEELTTLIGDLVELAREDGQEPSMEQVDLVSVVEHAIERVERRAPSAKWQVELEPWWVVGDDGGIVRAVTNVLDNAAKWSPTGGTITVRLRDGVLVVDDEGQGIAPADRPHVFDRFYRSSAARSMPGSGLGLSIVRQVAERHGGGVSADEAPGGGARIRLTLPGSPVPPEEVTGSASGSAGSADVETGFPSWHSAGRDRSHSRTS